MTSNQRRNTITRELANIMRAANDYKYRYGPSSAGSGIGSTDEYFATSYQIPSYTLEIEPLDSGADYGGFGISHDGFILPASEVSRMRHETSEATFAGLYSIAEVPSLQEVRVTQNNELVFHQIWQTSGSTRILTTEVNNALAADTEYQLNVIFNKPMRQLSNNQVVSFASFSNAESIILDLFIKTNASEQLHTIDTSQGLWLTQGFRRYKTDSYQVNFSLPENFDWNSTTLLALNVQTTDMTGQALDTNPATIADWQSGHWTNYENTTGDFTDNGGIDKSMRFINDGSNLYPDNSSPTAPTTPTEIETSSSNSGGGSQSLLWLMILSLFISQRLTKTK